MHNSDSASSAAPRSPVLFVRSTGDRLVAGVAAAAARRLGVDVVFVRAAFVVLSLAGGAGVLAYLLLWAATPESDEDVVPAGRNPQRRAGALGMQVVGVLLILRETGLWLGDALVWPLTLAVIGSCVMWARGDEQDRARWAALAAGQRPVEALLSQRASAPRALLGGALVLSGMFALLVANVAVGDVGNVLIAALVTAAGLALLVGPAMWRLARQLGEERREVIRSTERAEVGAHLHDSVLHTLALIQRSESPQEMATLARSQERELRSWLQGREGAEAEGLTAALEEMAARVEALHHVAIDVVVVGEAPLDGRLRAVVAACGEAAVNAARHSGADALSVYVEVEADTVTAYVRDEGKGFDPEAVPSDRRGIAESIRGRIERQGGTAQVASEPGDGTEVAITVPWRAP